MPRLPILALGVLTALALAVRPASAQEPAPQPKAAAPAVTAPVHAEDPTAVKKAQDPAVAAPKGPADGPAAASSKADSHGATPSNAAASHGLAQPDILEIQPSLMIWSVAVFVILLLILGRFAWGPILKALHDREEHMNQTLLDAEKARNEAERIMVENRKHLAQATDQVRALIEQGKLDAQVIADGIVRKAQSEADANLIRAEREIQSARDQALGEIFSKTADLAVSVAGKVLSKQLDEADHRRLVESAISELPASINGHGVKA